MPRCFFYLPETGEVVDELPPERYKQFIRELIKEPIRWHIENIKSGKYPPKEHQESDKDNK